MNFLANLPWWAYVAILIVVIVLAFIVYHYATRYTPKDAPLDPNADPLPPGFDANAEAENASNVLDETLGTDDSALFDHLAAMTDNEIRATYNAYNTNHYNDHNQTLTARIAAVDTFNISLFGLHTGTDTGQKRDDLVKRMQGLKLP